MMVYHNGIESLYLKWIPYDIFHDLSSQPVYLPKNLLLSDDSTLQISFTWVLILTDSKR